ncbi:hypothetical protein HF086_017664 [Spodoptera exigua]|uniref:Uncharacterized protein n=1 Tax=Spodoptera exigua TaxID=7107 RepID=A0A922SGW3_SPOEX|nr:hypothetical protein HF086_017664 [Spodoptera exigua]
MEFVLKVLFYFRCSTHFRQNCSDRMTSRSISLSHRLSAGRACPLKEVDTDVEERAAQRPRRLRHRTRSHKSQSEGEGNTTEGEEGKTGGKARRSTRRRNSQKSASKDKDEKPRRPKRQRPDIDFSVKGFRGFCYLHFFKPSPQKVH